MIFVSSDIGKLGESITEEEKRLSQSLGPGTWLLFGLSLKWYTLYNTDAHGHTDAAT